MSPNPSSICATDGSAQSTLPSHSSSTSTADEQRELSEYRINNYVASSEHPHAEHRHASSQQAIQTRTNVMDFYLEAFDATMKPEKK